MELPPKIKCPSCDSLANAHNFGGMILEICTGCGGIWFGSNQLKELVAEGPDALDELMRFEPDGTRAARKHERFQCPICCIPLHTNLLAGAQGIEIHTCYSCAGLFLEAQTFSNLDLQAHHAGKTPPPVSPEALAIAAQLDGFTQAEQRRTQLAYDCLRMQTMPYYGRRGWGMGTRPTLEQSIFPKTKGLL